MQLSVFTVSLRKSLFSGGLAQGNRFYDTRAGSSRESQLLELKIDQGQLCRTRDDLVTVWW